MLPRTLRSQLLVGVVLTAAAPLLALAGLAGARLVRSLDDAAAFELRTSAATVVDRADEHIVAHQRALTLLAATATDEGADTAEVARHLRRVREAFPGFRTLLVTDARGNVRVHHAPGSPPGGRTPNVGDRSYFRVPMATNAPYVSDAFVGRGFGSDPIVAVAVPVPGRDGRPDGVLEGSLDLTRFAELRRHIAASPRAGLAILDRAGQVVYSHQLPDLPPLRSIGAARLGAALGRTADGLVTLDGGAGAGPLLAAVSTSASTGWRVVVVRPKAAVRAAGDRHLRLVLAGIGAVGAVAVALALRLARRVTRPLVELMAAVRGFDAAAPLVPLASAARSAPEEIRALVDAFRMMGERVHAAGRAERASAARFRAIFDHAAIGIAVHGEDGRFVETNRALQRLVGRSDDELRRTGLDEITPPGAGGAVREPLSRLAAGLESQVQIERRLRHRDGHDLLAELTVSRLEGPDGARGFVAMAQDVTERRAMERELAWRADHDPLTGLANRSRLDARVSEALTQIEATGSVALLLLDLDEFKRVNDSLGHAEGDRLLCEVSQRLLTATRGCDLVARLGGDEFAIMLWSADSTVDATVVARRILDAFERPVPLVGAEIVLGVSIGIAHAVAGETFDEVARNADVAMYDAKRAGKGTFAVYTAAMHQAAARHLAIESDLRRALAADQLRAVYQPIVDLTSGDVAGAECLLRLRHGGHTPASPGDFIPVAERTGLIVPIGRWALREACADGAAWLRRADAQAGAPPLSVTVNVSGRQLHHASLVDDVRAALDASGLDPRALVLEITESVLMYDAEAALRRLSSLRALGVRLAIDDFGTGYSSLSYLQRLPVDVLKIDKSFVDTVTDPSRGAPLVRAIVALADTLGIRCVAEGIESAAQRDVLRDLGCRYGQGYLFGRPAPAADVGDLLARARRVA